MNIYTHETLPNPQFCIIWLHGLGSDGNDMLGLAKQLPLPHAVKHVCLNAPVRPITCNQNMPMRAWYDITGLNLSDREDRQGILNSAEEIFKIISIEEEQGFSSEKIFIAGFSQGGAVALFAGLNYEKKLAGIISLSSYLPINSDCKIRYKDTPIFMANGKFDTVVSPEWTIQSFNWLKGRGIDDIQLHEYPIAHSVSIAEINDITNWINLKIQTINSKFGENVK